MKALITTTLFLISFAASASQNLPSHYTELLKYVQPAPDQGESATCLFVASTGVMELLANKKNGITHPKPYGKFDLSESFLIHAPDHLSGSGKSFLEIPIHNFNAGFGIHINDWPYNAWNDSDQDDSVWNYRDWQGMKKVILPKVTTSLLFMLGDRWSTNVLDKSHVEMIKAALVANKAPVLVNYNDNYFWHVISIVGYDDNIPGSCYEIPESECGSRKGAFYVRDSFGMIVELRDYDWFRYMGNAAVAVKEVL